MNEIITINGIDCYEENGTAYLKLENVARGLGFTQVAASGNEVVRWERVKKYLDELGVPTSGDVKSMTDMFIPENIFYRLAMKAKNEAAERFQALVADEIIPSIRKHGLYATPVTIEAIIDNPDYGIQLLQALKQEREHRAALESKIIQDAPKVTFADAVTQSDTTILVGELAKILKQNGVDIGQNRLFRWLRKNEYLIKRKGADYNMPSQYAMDRGWFIIREKTIVKPDGSVKIVKTPRMTGRGQQYFVNCFLREVK